MKWNPIGKKAVITTKNTSLQLPYLSIVPICCLYPEIRPLIVNWLPSINKIGPTAQWSSSTSNPASDLRYYISILPLFRVHLCLSSVENKKKRKKKKRLLQYIPRESKRIGLNSRYTPFLPLLNSKNTLALTRKSCSSVGSCVRYPADRRCAITRASE